MKNKLFKKSKKLLETVKSIKSVKNCKLKKEILDADYDEFKDVTILVDLVDDNFNGFISELLEKIKTKYNMAYSNISVSDKLNETTLSIGMDVENPLFVVNFVCKALLQFPEKDIDCKTPVKYVHILNLWINNLKRYLRGENCDDEVIKMAKETTDEYLKGKTTRELFDDVLMWLEDNATSKYSEYIRECRYKFETLVDKNKKVKDFIKYVNEHSGAFAIFVTIGASIIGALLAFVLYSYYHGYFSYFSISEVWLDLSQTSLIYYPVFLIFVSLFIMTLNVIPILLSYCCKNWVSKSIIIGVFIFVILVIIVGCVLTRGNFNLIQLQLVPILVLSGAFWIVLYGIGLFEILMHVKMLNNKSRKKGSKKARDLIGWFFIAVSVAILVFAFYELGEESAKCVKNFKVIESYNGSKVVVLYETKDMYIVSTDVEYDFKKGEIYINETCQSVISKNDINYEIKEFNYVKLTNGKKVSADNLN